MAIVAVAFVAACGDKPAGPAQTSSTDTIATITLLPPNPMVPAGSTLALTAFLANAAGDEIIGRTIEWTSSRTDVARVNDAGVVLALESGSTTITATSEEKTGTTMVTVTPPVAANVFVSPPSVTVQLGRTVQLTAVATDAEGHVLTGKFVLWSSSVPTTVSVDDTGLVTGLLYPGTATIYAQVDGVIGSATVVVTQAPN